MNILTKERIDTNITMDSNNKCGKHKEIFHNNQMNNEFWSEYI